MNAAISDTAGKRVVLITGDGRGKTTSALGLLLRAVGHGGRACLVQFMKQVRESGELKALARFPEIDVHVCGRGFVPHPGSHAFVVHCEAARKGLRYAQTQLRDPGIGMVVLDEICGAVAKGLVSAANVIEIIDQAHPHAVMVLTGRDAPEALIARADTVSHIRQVKHAYDQGRTAQPGVEC